MEEERGAIVLFEDTPVRTVEIENENWIAAIDVAKSLGYDNPSRASADMIRQNKELFEGNERIVCLHSLGGRQNTRILNMKGVIAFCIKSNKKDALPFQKWATKVLEKEIKNIPSNIRLIAKQKRVKFTDTLQEHGCSKPHHYINITLDMKESLGIERDKKKDMCDLIEVMKIAASEDIARINMIQDNAQGYKECHDDSVNAAIAVGEATKPKQLQ